MPGWRILLWAVLVLSAVFFLYLVRGILLPFILSFVLAALLDPTIRRLRLRGWSRGMAVGVVVLLFYGGFIGTGVLLAPTITRETQNVADRIQELTTSISRENDNDNFFIRWNPVVQSEQSGISSQVDHLLAEYSQTLDRFGLPSSRRAIMEQYVDRNRPEIAKTVKSFSNGAFGFVTGLFSRIFDVLIMFILVPLILSEMEEFKKRAPKYVPPAIRVATMAMLGDIGQVFVSYLRGITSVVLLYGTVMAVLLGLAGVQSWILLAPLFAGLYLVPYIGNIISAITVFSVIGFSNNTGLFFHPVSSPWAYAAIITGIYLLIGLAFDHLIYPQMVGNSVGLSPVVSMFVIFCGAALFGLPGMLIAFPLAGSVKVIFDRLIRVTSTGPESLKLPSVPLRHQSAG